MPPPQQWRSYPNATSRALRLSLYFQLGLSVSTTHCLIGAITGVALVEGSGAINAQTIRKIVMSWLITVPASAVLGVLCFGPIGALFAPAELSTSGATLGQGQLLQPRPPPLPGAP